MSVRKALAWSYGNQAVVFLAGFSTSIIIARLLSPREMGVFAIATATAAVLSILTSLSVSSYIVRENDINQEFLRSAYTTNMIMAVSLFFILISISLLEYYYFDQTDVAKVMALLSISPILSAWEIIPSSLLQRRMDFATLSRVGMARTIITSTTTVLFAYAGYGSLSPAIGPIVSGFACSTFLSYRYRRDLVFIPTTRGLRPVFLFGIQIMSISGVAQISQRLSDVLIGRVLGLTELGLYSRASNLTNLVFANVYGMATSVVFSKMSKDFREKGTIHEVFLRSMGLITAAIWPLVIGIAVLSRPAIYILYGEKWLDAALPLSLLMIAQFVVLGFGMNWELFVLREETGRQVRFEAARAILGLGAFSIGMRFGIAGAAVGRIAEAVVGYILYRPHIDRLAGTRRGALEKVLLESLILTTIAVLPSFALMLWTDWAADTSVWLILASVLAGVAGWFAMLASRKHPLMAEIRLIVAHLRP